MELLFLSLGTLVLGYYAFLVWARPEQLSHYLRNFYSRSWLQAVASSAPAFWFVRLFVSMMFALFLAAVLMSVLGAR